MIKKIELLVHAGAPSGRKDDDKYRAQVQVYLAFEGRTVNSTRSAFTEAQDARDAPSAERQQAELTTCQADFLDDTQLAYTALDSQLFTSSLHLAGDSVTDPTRRASPNVPSLHQLKKSQPAMGSACAVASNGANVESDHRSDILRDTNIGFQTGRQRLDAQSNSGKTRLCHEDPLCSNNMANDAQSQSSYLKSPVLHRLDKKRKASSDLRQATSSRRHDDQDGVVYFPFIDREKFTRMDAVGEQVISRSQRSGDSNHTTSELPTSYSLSDVTSDSSRAKPSVSQRSASDPGPRISSISPSALRSVPISQKAVPPPSTAQPPENEQSVVVNAKINPQNPSEGPCDTSELEQLHELHTLSTSIYPPRPAVAIKSYTTHITDALRTLAENPDIKHSYKPVSVIRELRPLERGYWLINCKSIKTWGLQDQIDFWRFLERTIRSKAVGWGVWCTRENGAVTKQTPLDEASLGLIKAFCWGEIVSHIFLLLYVASKSKVRKLSLQWVDAEDQVVVQMRSR